MIQLAHISIQATASHMWNKQRNLSANCKVTFLWRDPLARGKVWAGSFGVRVFLTSLNSRNSLGDIQSGIRFGNHSTSAGPCNQGYLNKKTFRRPLALLFPKRLVCIWKSISSNTTRRQFLNLIQIYSIQIFSRNNAEERMPKGSLVLLWLVL